MNLISTLAPTTRTSLAAIIVIIVSLIPASLSFSPVPGVVPSSTVTSSRSVQVQKMGKSTTTTALSSCVAQEARSLNLFSTTPLIHSIPLSKLCHPHPVYLKLDLLQQSGSFKDRGMAHLCATVHKVYNANRKQKEGETTDDGNDVIPKMKVISSSGGNAGLAVTTVARNIPEMDVSVVVPETTKPMVIEKLRSLGADVTVHGANWNDADGLARQWVNEAKEEGRSAVYVSPFDNPLLWTGHSTVIDEIITQLLESQPPSTDVKMGAVLASVGGGGLLCGILEGIERNYYGGDEGKTNIVRGSKVVACETEGAASFAASFNASAGTDTASSSSSSSASSGALGGGQKKLTMVSLDGITSVATSLGALEVTPAVIQRAHRHQERGEIGGSGDNVLSYVCTDVEAIDACVKFSADHRMLVEPACGAALASLYSDRLRSKLLEELGGGGGGNDESSASAVVVEVCGGSGVNLDLLESWKEQFLGDSSS